VRRESSTKSRALAFLAGLAFVAALLLPAEVWARRKRPAGALDAESSPDFEYFHLQIHDPFFVLERKFGVIPYRYRTARPRAGGVQYFDARKRPGVARVFIIGGSVAMPFNAQEMSRLGEFLRRSLPGRRFEIVGCGMGGYDSYRESLVEEEVLRHEPDLIVLLSGNNEYAPALRLNPALYRLNRLLRHSRLYQEIQDSYQGRLKSVPWTLEERQENFEANLRLMIARARGKRVPIVLCTLPVNIRDIPPVFSREPAEDAGYFRARAALERGRTAEAARGFAAYAAAHPSDPWGHYWLGKALDLSGSGARARQAYLDAVDRDDPGDRCSPRRNAIIRGLAREDGAAVADVDAAFARLVPDGLTDSRLFKDGVHWYDEYYPLVSLAIVEAVAAHDLASTRPMLAPAGEWKRWWDPRFEAELSHPAMDPARRRRYADEVLMTAVSKIFQVDGFVEAGVSYLEMAERLEPGILERSLSSPDILQARSDANPWLEHVRRRLKGEWSRVLLHAGEACRRLGRAGQARAYLDESLRLAPEQPYARLSRGLLELSVGRRVEASADFLRASYSDAPGVKSWVAAVGS